MKRSSKLNLLFTPAVLAAALLLFWFSRRGADPGVIARLQYDDGAKALDISLQEDARYDLESGDYTIHLEVKDGAIASLRKLRLAQPGGRLGGMFACPCFPDHCGRLNFLCFIPLLPKAAAGPSGPDRRFLTLLYSAFCQPLRPSFLPAVLRCAPEWCHPGS